MILFEGQLSTEARKYILKKYFLLMFGISMFALILGIIPLILLIVSNEAGQHLIVYIAWMLSAFMITIFLMCFPFFTIKKQLPSKIEITDDYITCYFNGSELYGKLRYCRFEYVKKIVDYGNYYQLYFYYPHKIIGCVCQKDLLIEGTLEEFENLFKGKIIRKIK